MSWVQLYIKTKRSARELQHVQPLIMRFAATLVAGPDGLPIQTKDDLYEVRVFVGAQERLIERILADQELTIAARTEHEEEKI